ncbi:MAG: hypothetical protein RL062_1254, partial [Bacteroidota bacterium]
MNTLSNWKILEVKFNSSALLYLYTMLQIYRLLLCVITSAVLASSGYTQIHTSPFEDLYSNLDQTQFLQDLHQNKIHFGSEFKPTASEMDILFDYAASHPSAELRDFLKQCIVIQKNKSTACLFAFSQQENIGLSDITSAIAIHKSYPDEWKSMLGKCIRNEVEADFYTSIEMSDLAYCEGTFHALRNGKCSQKLIQKLLAILQYQIHQPSDITTVCRSLKTIPFQYFPILAIDSLLASTPVDLWNNRMAIQMLGKCKSPVSIQTIVHIACSQNNSDAIVTECLLQLLRTKEFPTDGLQNLLHHQNPEVVGLAIDCLAMRKQFQIPVSAIIQSQSSENKTIPQEVFWKVKSFEIQNPEHDNTLALQIWKAFVAESNSYHRMLALEAIQKEPSLFHPLLDFVLNSNTYTDLYYGTICLIAMSDAQQNYGWLEKLCGKNDEGIDALVFEYLREKISD